MRCEASDHFDYTVLAGWGREKGRSFLAPLDLQRDNSLLFFLSQTQADSKHFISKSQPAYQNTYKTLKKMSMHELIYI